MRQLHVERLLVDALHEPGPQHAVHRHRRTEQNRRELLPRASPTGATRAPHPEPLASLASPLRPSRFMPPYRPTAVQVAHNLRRRK